MMRVCTFTSIQDSQTLFEFVIEKRYTRLTERYGKIIARVSLPGFLNILARLLRMAEFVCAAGGSQIMHQWLLGALRCFGEIPLRLTPVAFKVMHQPALSALSGANITLVQRP